MLGLTPLLIRFTPRFGRNCMPLQTDLSITVLPAENVRPSKSSNRCTPITLISFLLHLFMYIAAGSVAKLTRLSVWPFCEWRETVLLCDLPEFVRCSCERERAFYYSSRPHPPAWCSPVSSSKKL
ncbi:unnamed protein product [Protopolystoma xenopodis]|uniref:Uncharacterized protein n=1 Tax=Protopolystoma xenopodis TaxID=117903 RepID=A0A448WPW8_9PLAT|nr:unnamed protein product [Protopolystoma xenopodis]